MIEGDFIVLEGIDGAGTTTHTGLLAGALRERGLPVRTTCEPSEGPIGAMLRQIMTGRMVVPGFHGGVRAPGWTTMALLFAADRMDHLDAEIVPNLLDGVTVISDRYDYSSVAYQSASSDDGTGVVTWIRQVNGHARRPDLTIVLDVPPEVAAERRGARMGRADELYEEKGLQDRLSAFYRSIDQHFPEDRIVHVDAARPVSLVAADVVRHVRILRNEEDQAPRS